MAKKITTTQLVDYIDREISQAVNYNSKITGERKKALKYYAKEPYGNEKKGRSTYVSSEVQEVISWALPQILKIFSTNDTISFSASRPEYKESAELATAYANHVINKENNGFLIYHDWFHDALLQKNGLIKVYYDKSDIYEREEYTDLTDAELTMLLQDPNVEPITHDAIQVIDPVSQQLISSKHDLTIKRKVKSTGGSIKIDNVPVEEVIISKDARSSFIDDAPFVAHRVKRSISWLRQQGYKIADDINDGTESSTDYSLEKTEREFQDGNYDPTRGSISPVDPSMRLVWVTESYLKVDFNNDGIAEQRKITKVGSTILDNEEVHIIPFISTTPFPQPHRYNGLSMADLVTDLQLLKSMLMRAMLDSFAFNINPSKAVDITKVVDVNDLLDTNPGNFIRMRGAPSEAVMTLPSSGVGGDTFNLLSYIDNVAESRSGVSKMTQGIDENMFNKTATGTQAIMNASQEKLALIVRIFAETGVANLYKKIIQLASKYSDGPEMIELNAQYIQVDPIEWKHLKSIDVHIGTGSLDKAQELANMNQLIQLQQAVQGSQKPELQALLDPLKIYNSINGVAKAMGLPNASQFFNRPGTPEYGQVLQVIQQQMQPPPPPPDPNLALVEAEKRKNEQDMLIKTAEFELDKLKADREFELKKYEMQLKYEMELMKLPQSAGTGVVASQLQQVGNLNPSNELLPESQVSALTRVLDNEGQNIGQGSLYAQILQQTEAQNHLQEQERERQKQESDAMLKVISDLNHKMNAPKKVIRDDEGRVIGIAPDTGE